MSNATPKPLTAAAFAEAKGIDQYAFRRFLRSQGTRVGKGRHHKLPADIDGKAATELVAAFTAAQEG